MTEHPTLPQKPQQLTTPDTDTLIQETIKKLNTRAEVLQNSIYLALSNLNHMEEQERIKEINHILKESGTELTNIIQQLQVLNMELIKNKEFNREILILQKETLQIQKADAEGSIELQNKIRQQLEKANQE